MNSAGGAIRVSVSINKFVDQLRASGLVDPETLESLGGGGVATQDSAERLAKELVKRGQLTEFQVRMIYNGRGANLQLGSYIIQEKIGAGGMGHVYKAVHKRMQRVVALKVLPAKWLQDDEAVARFHREVQVAARLVHPNVVLAYDADVHNNLHYLAMEYVNGVDLKRYVATAGRLSPADAISFIQQAAAGLAAAHELGIIHRDIKPQNLLLDREVTVKVLDLGLARIEAEAADTEGLTTTSAVFGTVDFMSPEQARESRLADARSDVYSLGCTLFFLLAGRSMYPDGSVMNRMIAHREAPIPDLSSVSNNISEELQEVFRKMVAKTPQQRYQSMHEVMAALESVAAAYAKDEKTTVETVEWDADWGMVAGNETYSEEFSDDVSTPAKQQTASVNQDSDRLLRLDSGLESDMPFTADADDATQMTAGLPDSVLSGDSIPEFTEIEPSSAPSTTDDKAAAQVQPRSGFSKRILVSGGMLLLGGFVLLWALGVFRVQTKYGTIVLRMDEAAAAGADVNIDDQQRITISTTKDMQPIRVEADGKTHKLKVNKGGFKTFTTEFKVDAGENREITVTLEPLQRTAPDTPVKPAVDGNAATMPATRGSPRQIAGWFLSRGAEVTLTNGRSGEEEVIFRLEGLPEHVASIEGVSVRHFGDDTALSSEELARLPDLLPELKRLRLVNVLGVDKYDADTLRSLAGLKQLETLELDRCNATSAQISDALAQFPELEELSVRGSSKEYSVACLQGLVVPEQLHVLAFEGAWVDNELASRLTQLTSLESLSLHHTRTSKPVFLAMAGLPSLVQCRLTDTQNLTADDWQVFTRLEQIRFLHLSSSNAEYRFEREIEEVSTMSGLRRLHVDRIEAKSLPHLARMKDLRLLGIRERSDLTDDQLQTLRQSLPKCEVGIGEVIR